MKVGHTKLIDVDISGEPVPAVTWTFKDAVSYCVDSVFSYDSCYVFIDSSLNTGETINRLLLNKCDRFEKIRDYDRDNDTRVSVFFLGTDYGKFDRNHKHGLQYEINDHQSFPFPPRRLHGQRQKLRRRGYGDV